MSWVYIEVGDVRIEIDKTVHAVPRTQGSRREVLDRNFTLKPSAGHILNPPGPNTKPYLNLNP